MAEQQQNEYLNDPELKGCWAVLQAGSDDQYMPEDRIIEWVNRAIAEKQLTDKFAHIDIKKMLHSFIKQVHELDRRTISNVMFKFEQAVEFYVWLVSDHDKNVQQQNIDQNNQQKHEQQSRANDSKLIQKQQNVNNNSKLIKKHQKHNQSHLSQKNANADKNNHQTKQHHISKIQEQKQEKHHQNKKQIQKHQAQNQHHKQQQKQEENQQIFLYPGGNKPHPHQAQNQANQQQQQLQEQNDDGNEFAQFTKKEEGQKQQQNGITKSYKQYLNIIFDHYCRMSYATGNDPTFEQIQQKTQVMTINKFMIFCKDFGIVKLNGMSRPILVQMFKKNSEFYKEMNYQQFVAVLVKISYMVYSPDSQDPQSETSKQFEQFLLFLQVNNLSTFKKKAMALSISLKSRNPNQNQAKKVIPTNYKFKYESNNQKTEQAQETKQERKRIQSQNKLKLALNQPRNATSKKNIIKAEHQMRNINDRPQIKSVQPTKKLALAPPIPPARKISTQTRTKVQTDPNSGVTGYANIHKLKMLGKQGQIDSKLKLNTVVEEAKKIIQRNLNGFDDDSQYVPSNRASTYGRETPNSNLYGQQGYSNLNQSERNSFSQRNINQFDEIPISKRSYAPHGHSYLEKKPKQIQNNAELDGIIDNDSDHDQYLQQHLNREKKSGHLNQRIEKKIKQIGMRQHY